MHDGGSSAEDVARRLALLRQWSTAPNQRTFAEMTGMTASEYNHFESGRRPLTVAAANKLRHRWQVTLDWLYHGDRRGLALEVSRSLPSLYDERSQA